MKIVIIPDLHGNSDWKLIVSMNPDATEWVFLGDYFDSYVFSAAEQIHNFKEIVEFKKANPGKVHLLLGNHDGYISESINQSVISGYQQVHALQIRQILQENKEHLKMAHATYNILCTHAGVGETWLERAIKYCLIKEEVEERNSLDSVEGIAELINDIWFNKPQMFGFAALLSTDRYYDPTGDSIGQSPIWIRPRSLMKDSQEIKSKGIIQIVGHTVQSQIDIKGKATGGKYFFVDTLETSREYLIIEDDKFKIGKV